MPIIIKKSSTNTSTSISTGTNTGTGTSTSTSIPVHVHGLQDVTGLNTALSGKANATHSHAPVDVIGLNTVLAGKADTAALDAKANATHTHVASHITDLQSALSNKADVSALSAKANAIHTHATADITGFANAMSVKADVSVVNQKSDKGHTHPSSEISDMSVILATKADTQHSHDEFTTISSALLGKANSIHSHNVADVSGLQTILDGKSSTSHTHAIASVTTAGLMSAVDKQRLDGLYSATPVTGTGSTSNHLATDIELRDRATHTGEQTISTITGLQSALDGKSSVTHSHTISAVTGLQATLDGKAESTHIHAIATSTTNGMMVSTDKVKLDSIASGATLNSTDAQLRDRSTHTGVQAITSISGLQAALDSKAGVAVATSSTAGLMSATDKSKLDSLSQGTTTTTNNTTTTPITTSQLTGLQTALDANSADITALKTRVTTLESNGTVQVQIPQNTALPVISGNLAVGSTITVSDGAWNNSPTSFTYQWYRRVNGNSSILSAFTAKTYVITSNDVGATLYCSVTAENTAGNTSVSSAYTATITAVPNVITAASITGSGVVGATLTAADGSWSGSPVLTYQWSRNLTAIVGATSKTYTVTALDTGKSISCVVTGTNQAGYTSSKSNSITIVAIPIISTYPMLNGNATVGSVITTTTGSWTNSPTSYSYQWMRGNTVISGVTSNSYTTVAGDVGAVITCVITATNIAGNSTATTQNSISVIAAVANAPAVSTKPIITGNTVVGSVLSVSSGLWTNSPTSYSYQWIRGNVIIANATNNTYTTVSSDVGASITCSVTASNAIGNASSITANTVVIGNITTVVTGTTVAGANPVTYAMTGTRTFNIGVGQDYADPDQVPWGDLVAGDVVNIFHRPTPYTHNIMVFGIGTATNKIIINGVTDSNGNRPQFSLNGSKTASGSSTASSLAYPEYGEMLGGFVLKRRKGATEGPKPAFITIKNIEIYGAGGSSSKFTALNGNIVTRSGSAGVWLHDTQDCTIENCVIYDNAFGIFVQAKFNILANANERVTVRNCRIYGNGVVNSSLEHNIYMQSTRPLIEGNYIGGLRAGALGSAYKSRSSGEIFRYNYVEPHARGMDFVHAEEQDDGIRADPEYYHIHCYGNTIVNATSINCIHVGGDNGGEDTATSTLIRPGFNFKTPTSLWYRKQLFFYNNTYVTKTNGAALFDLSLAGGQTTIDGVTHQRTRVDAWNNVFYTTGNSCAIVEEVGAVYFHGGNVFAGNTLAAAKTVSSTRYNIDYIVPAITGSVAFVNETSGNYAITSGASLDSGINGFPANLPSSFKTYPVQFQNIGTKSNGVVQRTTVGSNMDAGAYEYGISNTVTQPVAAISPVNSTAPIVYGNSAVGSVLSVNTGSWENSPTSFSYQWKRGTTNITGATSSTYTVVTADIDQTITVSVTGENATGSATANSSNGIVVSAGSAVPAPTVITRPNVTGNAVVGSVLTVSQGTWANSPTSFTYQWQRSGVNIQGATAMSYTTVTADIGTNISCILTGYNITGNGTATSLNTVLVTSTTVTTPVTQTTYVPPAITGGSESNPVTSRIIGIRTFDVGTGFTYPTPDTVPWSTLVAGDVVNIHYRETPYNSLIAVKGEGTATNPIIINGVTDANGNRPVFDVTNGGVVASGSAAIWNGLDIVHGYQRLGIVTVINGAGFQYLVNQPKFIKIQNLELKGAYTGNVSGTSKGNTITLLNGATSSWFTGAGIHLQSSEDVTIENCVIYDNAFGIFVMAKGEILWYTSQRVTLRNNRIYGNGVIGEYYQHNVYMQSTNPIIEGNYIGPLRAGANGSAYKSRSSGEIFRYNWVEAHARAIDFVHAEEQGNGTMAQPDYKSIHCYGNTIINMTATGGEFALNPVHVGGDNGGEDGYDSSGHHWTTLVSPGSKATTPLQLIYREQLYFYNNTYISRGNGLPYSASHIFDLSLAGGNSGLKGYVHPRTRVDAWNNVFYVENAATYTWTENCGIVNLVGKNYVFGNIGDSESARADWVTINKETLISGDPVFASLATFNVKPTAASPFANQSSTPTNLPSTFANYPVQYQPRIRTNGMVPRTASGASLDLGAYEIEDTTVPSVTTLPSISGASTIGATLTGNPGVWTNSPSLAYQWYRNSVAIVGATASTYTTVTADDSTNIFVRVTATANGKTTYSDSGTIFVGTALTPVTPGGTGGTGGTGNTGTTTSVEGMTLSIIGVVNVGQRVYASMANTNNTPIDSIVYKWTVGGVVVAGQTGSSYLIAATDNGKELVVTAMLGTNSVVSAAKTISGAGTAYTAAIGEYEFTQANGTTIASLDTKWSGSSPYYTIKDGYMVIADSAKSYGVTASYNHGAAINSFDVCINDGITSEISVAICSASVWNYEARISPTNVQVRQAGTWIADVAHNIDTITKPLILSIKQVSGKVIFMVNNIIVYSLTTTVVSSTFAYITVQTTDATKSRIDFVRTL